MKSKQLASKATRNLLFSCFVILLIASMIRSFDWPWENSKETPRTAEDILESHGYEDSNNDSDNSILNTMKGWSEHDTKESKKSGSLFEKFRFWEKNKEEEKSKVMKAKLLSALDVNADLIATQRDFMNDQVDINSDFEKMQKALAQLEELLLPVRRFIELDNQKDSSEYLNYPRTYMRRVRTLLSRLYSQRDDLKLQIVILHTNVDHFESPNFHFGVFYTEPDSRIIFEVLLARNEDKLKRYWKEYDGMHSNFETKIREIDELRKEADANLHLFYDALDNIMREVNTENQMFEKTFGDSEGDTEEEQQHQILEEVKNFMRNVDDRRARVLDAVSQIKFILKEVSNIKSPMNKLYIDVRPKIQLLIVEKRQFGRGKEINAEEYFQKKEIEAREKFMRDKVVENIEDKNVKVENIEDLDITKAVLNSEDYDPKSPDDQFLHLKDKNTIAKKISDQDKENQTFEETRRGDTVEENQQVFLLLSMII